MDDHDVSAMPAIPWQLDKKTELSTPYRSGSAAAQRVKVYKSWPGFGPGPGPNGIPQYRHDTGAPQCGHDVEGNTG